MPVVLNLVNTMMTMIILMTMMTMTYDGNTDDEEQNLIKQIYEGT